MEGSNVPDTMRDRVNDVIERAGILDEAVGQLRAFQGLLEDLNARCPLELDMLHIRLIEMVRSAILRSAIALVIAVLDSKRRDRAAIGEILSRLNDKELVEFLIEKRGQGGKGDVMRARLAELRRLYDKIIAEDAFGRVKGLRHNAIAHLLVLETETTDYSDVFALADQAEKLVRTLYEGLGMPDPPRFIAALKDQPKPGEGLFWSTYLAGVGTR